MSALRPCPFCGGPAEIQVHEFHELPNTYGVKCRNCDAQTRQFYSSEVHAITIWNIRVTPVRHGKWLPSDIPDSILDKCSECGFDTGAFTFHYCPNCGAKMDGGMDNG